MKPADEPLSSIGRRWLIAAAAMLPFAGAPRAMSAQTPSTATRTVLDAVRAKAQRAVVLEYGEGQTACRLGGAPRLPESIDWPQRKGRPLAFVAELDLAAIRAVDGPEWLPASGFLHLFYDAEDQPWGFDPADRDGWKIILSDDVVETAMQTPSALSADAVFAPVRLKGRSAMTYPTTERLDLSPEVGRTFAFEPVQALLDSDLGIGPRHQVGGYPAPIQGDGMELESQLASNGIFMGGPASYSDDRIAALEAGAADWRLLLQIDSDEEAGMMWGDVGILYVWVREQDARAGNFSNPWIILQCT